MSAKKAVYGEIIVIIRKCDPKEKRLNRDMKWGRRNTA